MAKLRRLETSAAGVLDRLVSMMILRLTGSKQNYKRGVFRTVLLASENAIYLEAGPLKKFGPFEPALNPTP